MGGGGMHLIRSVTVRKPKVEPQSKQPPKIH